MALPLPLRLRRRSPRAEGALRLDKVIGATLVAVFGLGVLAYSAVRELDRQVKTWGGIEAVDSARQDLAAAIVHHTVDPESRSAEAVEAAFDGLAAAIEAHRAAGDRSGLAAEAAEAVLRARGHFKEATHQQRMVTSALQSFSDTLDALYNFTSQLSMEARSVAESSRARSDELDARQAGLTERLHELFDALVSVQQISRQLQAFDRYNSSEAGKSTPLREIQIAVEALPDACAPDVAQAFCPPSAARLVDTISQIETAPPDKIAFAVRQAVWAADAYFRAAELYYSGLTAQLAAAVDAARGERERLAELRRREIAVSRFSRAINEMEPFADALYRRAAPDFDRLEGQVRGRLVQMRRRLGGVFDEDASAEARRLHATTLIDRLEVSWALAIQSRAAEVRDRRAFDTDLETLGSRISSSASTVRDSARRWIDIFGSTTIAVLALVGAAVVAASWLLHQYVSRPLTRITAALLALAEGRTDRPLVLTKVGAGMRRLCAGIETLRRASIERLDLMARNRAQNAQIESQLKTLERTHAEMERQALHDALTGLPNRRYADEYLPEMEREARRTGEDFALLHVDVDRFKEINDTIGHDAGDFILRHVAGVLKAHTREGDRTFRIGGDEFLIAVSRELDNAAIGGMAARIVEVMNVPVEYDGHTCRIGASIGIARGRDAELDARATLVNADMALYRAKKEGRNRSEFFTAELQRQMLQNKQLADQILAGIERAEFVPFYQPQFFSADQSLRGVEVLCRWHHPELGLLSPGAFLDIAQELRIIGEIDKLLFEQSARDLRRLREQGVLIPKISFNVTADRLLHQDLATTLRSAVEGDVKISIELLESMSLDTLSESVRWSIDALKERGIEVEIDDFGSCRASIAGLISVDPHAMKIDRAIVGPITTSEAHLRLVQAIVEIGRALDIEVVAEGVETEAHIAILRSVGCAVLQGYALSHPLSVDDLAAFLLAGGRQGHAA